MLASGEPADRESWVRGRTVRVNVLLAGGGGGGGELTEVLPEVAPAGDETLPPGREDVRGRRQAHGLDVPAEGQGAAQPQHRHVEVGGVGVVGGVRDDLGHAGPHRAGLGAAELGGASVGHPLGGILEPAGQTDGTERPLCTWPGWGAQERGVISGGQC